jgi:CBS domain-containing protein
MAAGSGQKVGDIMKAKVETVEPNTSAKDCAHAMAKKKVSCLVVVQGSAAMGIVTERDLVWSVMGDKLDPAKVLARDIMSTPLVTVAPGTPLIEAAKMMSEYQIRRLVVVDDNGLLAGIITAGDIARASAKERNYEDVPVNAFARIKASPSGGPYQ